MMEKELGKCDICLAPVYEDDEYIKFLGVYAHAECAQNYGKESEESK